MGKMYLVDSENVGDIWVPLLVASQPEDQVIVFYTQKSPHMNYENVRMLKETEKEADFIKCFEGNNALDFQLVSELGYRLHENRDCDYVIVSNDTGFDAVVRYWSAKNMPVSRLSGKECYRQLNGKKQQRADEKPQSQEKTESAEPQEVKEVVEPQEMQGIADPQETVAEEMSAGAKDTDREAAENPDMVENSSDDSANFAGKASDDAEDMVVEVSDDATEVTEQTAGRDDVVETLFHCISKENLVDFHNALVALLGEEEGKQLYQEIKGNAEYTTHWAMIPVSGQKEKFELYCRLVFDHSEFAGETPEDFASFLYQANGKRKNLNSLRAALQGHYGKDKGMRYYSLFKSHIKIMNRM